MSKAHPGLLADLVPLPHPPPLTAIVNTEKVVVGPTERMAEVITVIVEEAYKLLRVTAGTPWEEVEQSRRRLVQRSHPDVLKGLGAEKRAAVLLNAKRVNAAYAALAEERRGGA
jgi:DnaJ-domain-containing protein 1